MSTNSLQTTFHVHLNIEDLLKCALCTDKPAYNSVQVPSGLTNNQRRYFKFCSYCGLFSAKLQDHSKIHKLAEQIQHSELGHELIGKPVKEWREKALKTINQEIMKPGRFFYTDLHIHTYFTLPYALKQNGVKFEFCQFELTNNCSNILEGTHSNNIILCLICARPLGINNIKRHLQKHSKLLNDLNLPPITDNIKMVKGINPKMKHPYYLKQGCIVLAPFSPDWQDQIRKLNQATTKDEILKLLQQIEDQDDKFQKGIEEFLQNDSFKSTIDLVQEELQKSKNAVEKNEGLDKCCVSVDVPSTNDTFTNNFQKLAENIKTALADKSKQNQEQIDINPEPQEPVNLTTTARDQVAKLQEQSQPAAIEKKQEFKNTITQDQPVECNSISLDPPATANITTHGQSSVSYEVQTTSNTKTQNLLKRKCQYTESDTSKRLKLTEKCYRRGTKKHSQYLTNLKAKNLKNKIYSRKHQQQSAKPYITSKNGTDIWIFLKQQRLSEIQQIAAWQIKKNTTQNMMGGNKQANKYDIQISKKLLSIAFKHNYCGSGRALDLGAGSGRITKEVLSDCFKYVDLAEPNENFIYDAKLNLTDPYVPYQYDPIYTNKAPKYKFIETMIQDFNFKMRSYDCVWLQWTACYLTDRQLLKFLRDAKNKVVKTKLFSGNGPGCIIIRENELKVIDEPGVNYCLIKDDYSIMRSEKAFRKLFKQAGYILRKVFRCKNKHYDSNFMNQITYMIQPDLNDFNLELSEHDKLPKYLMIEPIDPKEPIEDSNFKITTRLQSFPQYQRENQAYKNIQKVLDSCLYSERTAHTENLLVNLSSSCMMQKNVEILDYMAKIYEKVCSGAQITTNQIIVQPPQTFLDMNEFQMLETKGISIAQMDYISTIINQYVEQKNKKKVFIAQYDTQNPPCLRDPSQLFIDVYWNYFKNADLICIPYTDAFDIHYLGSQSQMMYNTWKIVIISKQDPDIVQVFDPFHLQESNSYKGNPMHGHVYLPGDFQIFIEEFVKQIFGVSGVARFIFLKSTPLLCGYDFQHHIKLSSYFTCFALIELALRGYDCFEQGFVFAKGKQVIQANFVKQYAAEKIIDQIIKNQSLPKKIESIVRLRLSKNN